MSWFDRLLSGFKRPGSSGHLRGQGQVSTERSRPLTSLPDAGGTVRRRLPKFQSSASEQLNPKPLDRFAAARMLLRNAFTPSQPVIDVRMFSGRTEILSSLIRSIEEQRLHAVIYGQRGIGKTSILHVLAQLAREARYQVIYISCGSTSNLDEVFRAIAAGIPLLFHSKYRPTMTEAESGATLADLLPPGPINVRMANDILSNVTGTRVLVVLDEFDRCESSEFTQDIAELLKKLSDRAIRVQVVIAGVAANLTELIRHIPSIQRNITAVQIPKMTAGEIEELITGGADLSGVTFDRDAIDRIIAASNGLPYLASLLAQHAGLNAIDDQRVTAGAEDVARAISRATAELKRQISVRSQAQIAERIDDNTREILGALSRIAQHTGGRFGVTEIAHLYPQPWNAEDCVKLIESLAADGVLVEVQADDPDYRYRFIEEGVPPYLWLLSARPRKKKEASRQGVGPAN